MNSRKEVLEKIQEEAGFYFEESELSPKLRKKINLLTQKKEQIDDLYHIENELTFSKQNMLYLMLFLGSCGIICIISALSLGTMAAFLGIAFLLCTYLVYTQKYIGNLERIQQIRREIASQYSHFIQSLNNISNEVYVELSRAYYTKIMPKITHMMIDFADILELIEKEGIILKEFNCPHCSATLPLIENGEWTVCKYCGKRIYAIDVLKQVKKILRY